MTTAQPQNPARTYISSIRLTDFRSYAELDAAFAPGLNVFYGPNGAGKTNLLEALSLLSPGRGLRRAKVEDVTRREPGRDRAPAWGVVAEVETPLDELRIQVGQNPDAPARRVVRIDGNAASQTQMAETLTVLWLTPAQDRLFTGPASERRRFLDRFSLAHTPAHGAHVSRYEQLRSERNRLLSDGYSDAAWFRALEADLARFGAQVAAARVTTVELLREEIASRPEGPFPKAEIGLVGLAEEMFAGGAGLDEVRVELEAALAARRPEERRAGRTLVGPHRSDLEVVHAPKNRPAEDCSTGEQKALLLGLVLAHARSHPERSPILLLDEVAAHLDRARRASLAHELVDLGSQVFLTGTDRSLFEAFEPDARMLEVRDGVVTQTK